MDVIGITKEERDMIFCIISSVLQIGNIDFKQNVHDESLLADKKSQEHLQIAAMLLGIDHK